MHVLHIYLYWCIMLLYLCHIFWTSFYSGLPSQAFEYIRYNPGLTTEKQYPYQAKVSILYENWNMCMCFRRLVPNTICTVQKIIVLFSFYMKRRSIWMGPLICTCQRKSKPMFLWLFYLTTTPFWMIFEYSERGYTVHFFVFQDLGKCMFHTGEAVAFVKQVVNITEVSRSVQYRSGVALFYISEYYFLNIYS